MENRQLKPKSMIDSNDSKDTTKSHEIFSQKSNSIGKSQNHTKSFFYDDDDDDDNEDDDNIGSDEESGELEEAIDHESYRYDGEDEIQNISSHNDRLINDHKLLEVQDIFGISSEYDDDEALHSNGNDDLKINYRNSLATDNSEDTYSNISFIEHDEDEQETKIDSQTNKSPISAQTSNIQDTQQNDNKSDQITQNQISTKNIKIDSINSSSNIDINNSIKNSRIVEKDDYNHDNSKKTIESKYHHLNKRSLRIADKFTFQEREKYFLTVEQQIIGIRDVPERFLSRDVPVTVPESMIELEDESQWIFDNVFSETNLSFKKSHNKILNSSVIPKIRNTLDLLRNQFLEVPFIFSNRKEFIFPGLNISDLWHIYEWDAKWNNLKKQKNALKILVDSIVDHQNKHSLKNHEISKNSVNFDANNVKPSTIIHPFDVKISDCIDSISSAEQINDVLLYMNFYYSEILFSSLNPTDNDSKNINTNKSSSSSFPSSHGGTQKQPSSRSIYSRYKYNDIIDITKNFGITPSQLAENIYQDFFVHNIQQCDQDLETLCGSLINDLKWTSKQKLVDLIVTLVAHEISVEIQFNEYLRKKLYKNGLVSTCPTQSGLTQIDRVHPYFQYKYLKNKPLSEFGKTDFLEIFDAEQQGFLKVTIDLKYEDYQQSQISFFEQMLRYYQINQYSLVSQSWDKHREKALSIAFYSLAMPRLVSELKVYLLETSKEYLLDIYCSNLNALLSTPPFYSKFRHLAPMGQKTQNKLSFELKDTMNSLNSHLNHNSNNQELQWDDPNDVLPNAGDNDSYNIDQFRDIENPLSSLTSKNQLDPTDIQNLMNSSSSKNNKNTYNMNNKNDNNFKIMSFVYSNDPKEHSAVVCIIDYNCELLAHLVLKNFDYGRLSSNTNITSKANDVKKLKDFIKEHQPTDIVLSTQSSKAKNFRFEFDMILMRLSDEFPLAKSIQIHYADHRVAELYMASDLAKEQYPHFTQLILMAISLGRFFIDPFLEIVQLFDPTSSHDSSPLLALNFHPLQQLLSLDSIYWQCYKIIVTKVNEYGVEFPSHDYFNDSPNKNFHLLQFISGLGPCKIAWMRRRLMYLTSKLSFNGNPSDIPLIMSRADLVTHLDLGPYIFANCSGFIRFAPLSRQELSEALLKNHLISFYLDSTRIHPESYHWAIKMVQDALAIQDDELSKIDEIFFRLKDNYHRLYRLDIDAYAKKIKQNGFGDKYETLFDIKNELCHAFADPRGQYQEISPNSLFELFYHGNLQNIKIGRIVIAKVISFAFSKLNHNRNSNKHDDHFITNINPLYDEQRHRWICTFCKESNFLEIHDVYTHVDQNMCRGRLIGVRVLIFDNVIGFIPLTYISDEYNLSPEELSLVNPKDKLKTGMLLHCIIKKINLNRQEVILSCRTSDLQHFNHSQNHHHNNDDNKQLINYNNDDDFNDKNQTQFLSKYKYINKELMDNLEAQVDKIKNKPLVSINSTTSSFGSNLNPNKLNNNNSNSTNSHYIEILPRNIVHPKFKNVTYFGAVSLLKNQDPGQMLFRPHRGRNDHLTLTWKVANPDIFANFSILEMSKVNEVSLGKELYVEGLDDKFDDLDEIIFTLSDQLQSFAYQVTSHKYYESSIDDKKEAEKYLQDAKDQNPSRVPYIFSMNAKIPGKVLISYMPNKTPYHEFIDFLPNGFKFRNLIFSNFEKLISWFKLNFNNKSTFDANVSHNLQLIPKSNNPSDSLSYNSNQNLMANNSNVFSLNVSSHATLSSPSSAINLNQKANSSSINVSPNILPQSHNPESPKTQFIVDPNGLSQIPKINNVDTSSMIFPNYEELLNLNLNKQSNNQTSYPFIPPIVNQNSVGLINAQNILEQAMMNQLQASQMNQGLIPHHSSVSTGFIPDMFSSLHQNQQQYLMMPPTHDHDFLNTNK